MVPKKSSAGTEHVEEGQNSRFTNTQDHILLKALRDLILHIVSPNQTNDINQITLGPEAGKLITALQEFVASIVGRSESTTKQNTVVEVSLVEEDDVLQGKDDEDDKGALLPTTSSIVPLEDGVKDDGLQLRESSENPRPTFQDKLLRRLREHVFNTMPIRMLTFEQHESSLRITLVEKGVIYARLASALRAKMHEADHIPIVLPESVRLETEEQAIERLVSKYSRYAILSHTWLRTSTEVTFGDWKKGRFDVRDPGYQKLVNFCKVAWRNHGLTLGWMDTVCINKESSSELDESIRSMYNWYSGAAVCITYLAETTNLSYMHIDPWFTRGWTLQELLAPSFVKFYNKYWMQFLQNPNDDKGDRTITYQIKRATTISKEELATIRWLPISRKMQLAATREVTREEDAAYSLMGIFDVSISIAYGEGAQRSFFRLLQEILASSMYVMDILNWAGDLSASDT